MEAIGEKLFRAKAKRRKACVVGESARSDECPISVGHHARSGDGMVSKSLWSYLVRSVGFRAGGRPENIKDGGR